MPRDEVLRWLNAQRQEASPLEKEMIDFSGPCAVCGVHVDCMADRNSYPIRRERMCPLCSEYRWYECWVCQWWWLGFKRVSDERCIVCMREVCTWCSEPKSAQTRARLCLEHRANPWFCDVCFTHADGTFGNCWMCAVRCCEECSEEVMFYAPPQRECINCALQP